MTTPAAPGTAPGAPAQAGWTAPAGAAAPTAGGDEGPSAPVPRPRRGRHALPVTEDDGGPGPVPSLVPLQRATAREGDPTARWHPAADGPPDDPRDAGAPAAPAVAPPAPEGVAGGPVPAREGGPPHAPPAPEPGVALVPRRRRSAAARGGGTAGLTALAAVAVAAVLAAACAVAVAAGLLPPPSQVWPGGSAEQRPLRVVGTPGLAGAEASPAASAAPATVVAGTATTAPVPATVVPPVPVLGPRPVRTLVLGTCFQDPPAGQAPVETVEAVDCAAPHDNEVVAVFDLDAGPWPGDAAVAETAGERCTELSRAAVERVDADPAEWRTWVLVPSREGWTTAGDRLVHCVAYRADGPATGALAG